LRGGASALEAAVDQEGEEEEGKEEEEEEEHEAAGVADLCV
jgi:hypothetical protein